MGYQRVSQTRKTEANSQPQGEKRANYSPHPIEELQGWIGNRAMGRLLQAQGMSQGSMLRKPLFRGLSHEWEGKKQQREIPVQAQLDEMVKEGSEERAEVNSQPSRGVRKPLFRGLSYEWEAEQARRGIPVQAKLMVGKADDRFEEEADRVAAQVVQQMDGQSPQPLSQGETVQREEMEEERLQRKPSVASLSVVEGGMAAPAELEAAIQGARGSGQPLDKSVREQMEQAFGVDFSGVRIHVDATSDELNQSLSSRAFTTGEDIFFRQGEYEPENRKELIAHELTHVVQQNGGVVQQTQQQEIKQKFQLATSLEQDGVMKREADAMTQNPLNLNTNIIQCYFSGENFGMPGARISENYKAIVAGKQELYATQDLIKSANSKLANKGGIYLELGEDKFKEKTQSDSLSLKKISEEELFRVQPVMENSTPENVGNTMFPGDVKPFNPAKGDTLEVRLNRKEQYKKYLFQQINALQELQLKLNNWVKEFTIQDRKNLSSSIMSFLRKEKKPDLQNKSLILDEKAKNALDQIINQWDLKNPGSSMFMIDEKIAILNAKNVEDFEEKLALISQVIVKIEEERKDPGDFVLPVDCGSVAACLTGQSSGRQALPRQGEEPDIGQAHIIDFGVGEGWKFHWGTVLMKDGNDTITLENFAGNSTLLVDTKTWYFGMYGSGIHQTFQAEYWNKHAARSKEFGKTLTPEEIPFKYRKFVDPAHLAYSPEFVAYSREQRLDKIRKFFEWETRLNIYNFKSSNEMLQMLEYILRLQIDGEDWKGIEKALQAILDQSLI